MPFGLVRHQPVAQRLGNAAHGGQRRAQLVRYIGHIVAARTIQALSLGDIQNHGNRAAALLLPHRQRAETNQQRFFAHLHFFRLQRFRNGTL